MCWTPELIEFPCKWKKDNSPNFEELGIEGIENEEEDGNILLDIKSIVRVNEHSEKNRSVVEISGGSSWNISLPISDIKKICRSCGVNVKSSKEILKKAQPDKTEHLGQ